MFRIKIRNLIRRKNAFNEEYYLYRIIDKNPGITIYDLSKRVGWSVGKINHYMKKLFKDGVIKSSTETINGRVCIHYSPKNVKELINWDEMTHTERKERFDKIADKTYKEHENIFKRLADL